MLERIVYIACELLVIAYFAIIVGDYLFADPLDEPIYDENGIDTGRTLRGIIYGDERFDFA